jgi:hypothetical protein
MDVSFLWVGKPVSYPVMMLQSIRKVMPAARIVQMTDQATEALAVDEVIRRDYDGHLMLFRLQHLMEWPHSQAVILDTDLLVKGDLEHVFEQEFDVALTERLVVKRKGFKHRYNAGVMFSRCPAFWRAAYDWLVAHPDQWDWWGDQSAICEIAPQFKVLNLPCERYNWTPPERGHRSDALVWHYKGKKRKEWMHEVILRV